MTLEKILLIGKDQKTQKLARDFAEQLFVADDINDAIRLIDSALPDLIFLCPDISYDTACDFIRCFSEKGSKIPVVTVDCKNSENLRKLSNNETNLYTCKSLDKEQIQTTITQITQGSTDNASQRERFFSNNCPSSVSIVGHSKAIQESLQMTRLVANSTCNPILIVGETGTGKELAARAVHILRHGSDKKFVAVNCAALTANLLESELFGHVKGSFTSADREKTGLLELAGSGTCFLDEISEMPLELQAKLLRVMQEKVFRKVGGIKDIDCGATIIASSNKNLLEQVKKKKFRRDLYYRLAICPITLAPLRASSRIHDIPLLAEYFIKSQTICPDKNGQIKGLTKLAAEALQKHLWPGNVRELRNVIERAILLEQTDKIGLNNLIIDPEQAMCPEQEASGMGIKDFSLEKAEKELIAKALKEAGWQKTRAAAMLGITRATLYAKVKQYNIQPSANKPQPETVGV